MKFQTTFCQEYFAINPKLAEQLLQIEQVLKTEFYLECAGWQYVSNNWLGNPEKICWYLKVVDSEEKVGELVYNIEYDPSDEVGFSFASWLDDEGYTKISYGNLINDKLYSMLNTAD